MRIFLPFLFIVLLVSTLPGPASAQETPANTRCSDKSALTWDMNTEPDMDHYNVYAANNPIDPLADNTNLLLLQVPQPAPGAIQVIHPLNSTLSEGDKYFRVTAVDTPAANESTMSAEVGCDYNLVPGAPQNLQIILKLAPAS